MSNSQREPHLACPECGADWTPRATRCWVCGHEATAAQPPVVVAELAPSGSPYSFSLATLMLLVTAVALCLGVGSINPPLGILGGVVLIPIWLISTFRIQRRRLQGAEMTPGERLVEVLASTAIVIGVLWVLCIATGIALFGYCMVMLATNQ